MALNLPVVRRPEKIYRTPDEILSARAHDLITEEEGLGLLRKYLKRSFNQERIVKMIDNLCEAEDIRTSTAGLYRTPNWSARKEGLDRVMKLLDLYDEKSQTKDTPPSQIIFNVITESSAKALQDNGNRKKGR